jgi:hypothetical protein
MMETACEEVVDESGLLTTRLSSWTRSRVRKETSFNVKINLLIYDIEYRCYGVNLVNKNKSKCVTDLHSLFTTPYFLNESA